MELAVDGMAGYGPGTAMLSDGTHASENADYYWSPYTLIPQHLGTVIAPVDWFDFGANLGWLGGSVDARLGWPATRDRRIALNLAAGMESGAFGPFQETKPRRARWVRLEAYPLLRQTPSSQVRLMVALGLNTGRFFHSLTDPRPSSWEDGLAPDNIQLLRDETRIETAFGVHLMVEPAAALLLGIEPYVVVRSANVGGCDRCDPIASYRQAWGTTLVARGSYRFLFGP